jgi:hypothetical protein
MWQNHGGRAIGTFVDISAEFSVEWKKLGSAFSWGGGDWLDDQLRGVDATDGVALTK